MAEKPSASETVTFVDHSDGSGSVVLMNGAVERCGPLLAELLIRASWRRDGSRFSRKEGAWWLSVQDARSTYAAALALYNDEPEPAVALLDAWSHGRGPEWASRSRGPLRPILDLPGLEAATAAGITVGRGDDGSRVGGHDRDEPQISVTLYGYADRAASITLDAEKKLATRPPWAYARPVTGSIQDADTRLEALFRAVGWSAPPREARMTGCTFESSFITINPVRAADACATALCLRHLWHGDLAAADAILTQLADRKPDHTHDRWLAQRQRRDNRQRVADAWTISPPILPDAETQHLEISLTGPSLVPASTPATRKAAEQIARYFHRESAYDFAPYIASDGGEQTPWLAVTTDDGVTGYVLGCAGMQRRDSAVNLAWIWLHPLARGDRRMHQINVDWMLDGLEANYGHFAIEGPYSPAMLAVMKRRGIGKNRQC
ncbi:hypothetical protein [Spirillospora sp. CA-128828]|uniref:hypothetical protein n=1 Tax=Spirillospora sp. CA-128828 TaxID=3240033 RepID=UPI003D8B99FC